VNKSAVDRAAGTPPLAGLLENMGTEENRERNQALIFVVFE
jgi:hypothetical protein